MSKLTILFLISNILVVNCCNKSLCGSIVTKCLLTKSCRCEDKVNVRCYKECFTCLEDLYHDCCPCFEFCPSKAKISTNNYNEIAHVENLERPMPELFEVLTDENDGLGRWTSASTPVQLIFENSTSKKKVKFIEGTKVISGNDTENFHANCNVAFMSKCLSWAKCRSACISMGSASYAWFHNGCCECLGKNCINHGIGQCLDCPSKLDNLSSDLVDFSNSDNESIYDNSNSLNKNKN